MSTAARKARKRAGIPFERAPKTPTLAYETPRGRREGRRLARKASEMSRAAVAAAVSLVKVGQR